MFLTFLLYSDSFMPLLTIIVFLLIHKSIGRRENVILVYCLLSFLIFLASDILGTMLKHNLYLYHIHSLVELTIIGAYLLKLIQGKYFSIQYFIIAGGYLVFWILNIMFLEDINDMNAFSGALETFILLLLCMVYFFRLSKKDEILYFQKLPAFWIVSGFLIYCALSMLIQVSYKYFVSNNFYGDAKKVWPVMFIAIISKFVLITVGLLCYYKRNLSSRHLLSL